VIPPGPARQGAAALLLALLTATPTGCTTAVEGTADAAPADATPATPDELEELLLAEVPSGLPRVPDHDLSPPAGEKTAEDVAGYAEDPHRERSVLEDYGYRYGWERYWGSGTGPLTSVFIDQFASRPGAVAYAEDLAVNDVALYGGVLREDPPHLPGGCRLLTLEDGAPASGLVWPAAFAWCAHGVFSVAVTVFADTIEAAAEELHAVVADQLDRLPPS
jgi:hypothetical protein